MEHGTMRVECPRSLGAWFEREVLPWKELPLEEKERKSEDRTHLFSGLGSYKLEVRRCPKCRLVLFGY